MQEVNYEVQVQQGGRWSIHARFRDHQKDDAIEEGKELDRLPNIEAVKVIKEVYDHEREVHNEFIIYKSAVMRSSTAAAPPAGGGAGGGYQPLRDETWLRRDDDAGEFEDDYDFDGDFGSRKRRKKRRKKKKKKGASLTSVLVKLLMVVLFSICLAALFAVMASELLGGTRLFGVHIVGNAESNLLIGVFLITFLTSAVGMAVKIMRGQNLDASRDAKFLAKQARRAKAAKDKAAKAVAGKEPAPKSGAHAAAGPSEAPPDPASTDTLNQLEDSMKGVEEFKIEDQAPAADSEAKAAEDKAVNERLQAELQGKEPEKPSEEPAGRGVVLDAESQPQAKPAEEAPPLSPQAEKQKAYMMGFLGKALESQKSANKKMDNFNKFGVNLYLAGACEVLSQKRNLDLRSRSRILADGVQAMGFKKSHAASFADRYEEYLMADSRYMQMFQAGRNAMNIHMTDETSAPRLLDGALEEWNKPKQKEEQAGPVTVLFTDIAGSTAMTQSLGDAGAQQVVRAHNRIVREALSANAGKEIKHTGDGIMASFNKTSDGVDAAIQMQRGTVAHNEQNPELPLHLKIGINAGEPIAEDNDLFGTTVQLSARIVDKAAADEIFVSEIVRGICAGKQYKFVNRGGYPMKGFGDDVILYEVVWNDIGGESAQAAPEGVERQFAPTQVAAAAAPAAGAQAAEER